MARLSADAAVAVNEYITVIIMIIITIILYIRIISYASLQDEEMANLWTPHAKNLNPTHLKWLYNSIPRSRGNVVVG